MAAAPAGGDNLRMETGNGATNDCISGLILSGNKSPRECPALGKACLPRSPLGETMASHDGACAAYHDYGRHAEAIALGGVPL